MIDNWQVTLWILNSISLFVLGTVIGAFITQWLRKGRHHIGFGYSFESFNRKEVSDVDLTCFIDEKIRVSVNPKTANGQPSQIDGGAVVAAVSGDAGVGFEPSGLAFWLIPSDIPGTTVFEVSGDADMDPSSASLIKDTITLTTKIRMASDLGLVADAPVPK